jgi:hypothetical protein
MRAEGLTRCPTAHYVAIHVKQRGVLSDIITASWHPPNEWSAQSTFALLHKQEEAERHAIEQARIEQEQKRAREKRRQVALADCGGTPKLVGGPWFSSTYSVAARDVAQHANGFACVKLVEYISAAPNPFGGKAARVRLTGFDDRDFQPKVAVIDIPY